jgi:hypothetical protein
MYAQGRGKITCAAPGAAVQTGERPSPGCVQPATTTVVLGGIDIEFCEGCASKYEQPE